MAEAASSPRRIFVGDIQGCLEPLQRLLVRCGYRAGYDHLHPAGDLVAKGPDSDGVLEFLRSVGAEPVLGNHDLRWLRERQGDASGRAWLRRQPITRVWDDLILVHAGLHPHWTTEHIRELAGADVGFAVTVRHCDADGNQPASRLLPPRWPYLPWDAHYRGRRRVVFGHWARRRLVCRGRVIGLDTGCVYGGRLTAWIAEEERIVQVAGSRWAVNQGAVRAVPKPR